MRNEVTKQALLRKKCPYSVSLGIQSVQMQENTDQNNSEYGYFSRSDDVSNNEA